MRTRARTRTCTCACACTQGGEPSAGAPHLPSAPCHPRRAHTGSSPSFPAPLPIHPPTTTPCAPRPPPPRPPPPPHTHTQPTPTHPPPPPPPPSRELTAVRLGGNVPASAVVLLIYTESLDPGAPSTGGGAHMSESSKTASQSRGGPKRGERAGGVERSGRGAVPQPSGPCRTGTLQAQAAHLHLDDEVRLAPFAVKFRSTHSILLCRLWRWDPRRCWDDGRCGGPRWRRP